MSKIMLLSSTDKNINELNRKELSSVDWNNFPFAEQLEFLDIKTYKKLKKHVKRAFKHYLTDYKSKPVEFWNVLAGELDNSHAHALWFSSDVETRKLMFQNHKEWFVELIDFDAFITFGMGTLTDKIHQCGTYIIYDAEKCYSFANPAISLEEFNSEIEYSGTNYKSVLDYMFYILDLYDDLNTYPILVPNEMLTKVGFAEVPDLCYDLLTLHNACEVGKRTATVWIRKIGKDGVLKWDDVVNYIRSNHEIFQDHNIMNYLCWWWETAYINRG